MILAVDVDYREVGAIAAGVLFEQWADAKPLEELVISIPTVEAYEPGQFYKRELPCIIELFCKLARLPEFVVIDGHVFLDGSGKAGLGKHLFDSLDGRAAVIGVAKSRYKDTSQDAALNRAGSSRALYVTATGTDTDTAKGYITQMHGPYRLPTLLKYVDQLSRRQENRSPARI